MVPFYFNPRNTMMYMRASERVPLCILVTRIERILDGTRRVAFSDGNLAANVSRSFCDRRQFTDVRWDLVKTASWAGDRDVERIMCAEFLVEDLVPADLIDSVKVGGPKGRAVAIARLAGTRLAGHVKMNSRLVSASALRPCAVTNHQAKLELPR